MMMKLVLGILLLVLSYSAAIGSEISIWASGQAYLGGPAFAVRLGGALVGEAVVDPISSSPDGTVFTFAVEDSELEKGDALSVEFTNDLFKADVGDRNLRIVRAKVGAVDLAAGDFELLDVDGSPLPGHHGVLAKSKQRAVAVPPETGWLGPACDALAQVTGFATGVIAVSPDQEKQLAALLAQASEGECRVTIRGYSSTAGATDINQQVAADRAAAVLEYLNGAGGKFTSADVTGVGETDQFGTTQADNRLVTVELSR